MAGQAQGQGARPIAQIPLAGALLWGLAGPRILCMLNVQKTRAMRIPRLSQPEPLKKNPHAQALGRLSGAVRLIRIPAKRRKEIAAHAAQVRWSKKRGRVEGK
jgi:hypothetical protein